MNQDRSNHDTNTLDTITDKLANGIEQVTTPSMRSTAMIGVLGLASVFGGNQALGQSIETYNDAKHTRSGTSIEQVTTVDDNIDGGYVNGVTAGVSTLSENMGSPTITTTGGATLSSGTEVYAFSEHDLETETDELELKANQSIGDHKATVGYSPTSGELYGGFRANHFQDQGFGAHIKQAADGDIDIGGSVHKLWDSGVFTGARKENDNIIGVLGKPSADGPAVRATTIYGVEDNDGFMLNEAFLTSSSVDTYFGENRNNQVATSNGSVIAGSDAQTMDNAPDRYKIKRPNMFMSDGPTGYVAHTQLGDTHSVEAEAFTDLASLGADNLENTLVGAHASKTIGEPGLDRLGVDLGYNGDDVNAAVSVGSGPDGEPVGKVTFHYTP